MNGEEFGDRFRMPADAKIDFETLAANGGDARRNSLTFDPALLNAGKNTIAVEVHQASRSSSDVVFGLQLTVEDKPGSPGRPEIVVQLNEVAAQADGTGWVELFNSGDLELKKYLQHEVLRLRKRNDFLESERVDLLTTKAEHKRVSAEHIAVKAELETLRSDAARMREENARLQGLNDILTEEVKRGSDGRDDTTSLEAELAALERERQSSAAGLRVMKMLRLIKLVRILRASRIINRWQDEISAPYAQRGRGGGRLEPSAAGAPRREHGEAKCASPPPRRRFSSRGRRRKHRDEPHANPGCDVQYRYV